MDSGLIRDDNLVREISVNKGRAGGHSLSALTKRRGYSTFSLSAEAKTHSGIISGTSSFSSNKCCQCGADGAGGAQECKLLDWTAAT